MELKNEPQTFKIVKIADPRGNLSVLQYPMSLPFEPARVYWIHDAPAGSIRFGRAFYSTNEVMVALSGSVDVSLHTADMVKTITLNRADEGLFIPAMTWRDISNFATNSVVMVVSSNLFDETDYIRDIEMFNQLIHNGIQ